MATSAGSAISYTDLKNWYTAFNSLARNYSNGISTVSVPSSDSRATASHINTLHGLITRFRSDKFLGTQSAYWPAVTNVSAGNYIESTDVTRSITRAYSNASRVKCKNTASNNKGTNDSTCPNGTNYIKCGSGRNSDGGMYNGSSVLIPNSNGACSKGYNNSGTCQSGSNGSGTFGNGTVIDILNSSATKSN